MNDRFKFRAWDKTENTYIEDAQFTYDDGCEGGVGSFRHYSFRNLLEDENCIVEQCTGLKDKNGKLIYEGDVLKCVYSEIMQYRVYWEGRGYRMRVYGSDNKIVDDCPIFVNAADVLEVIGNIHENADLLENEE